MLWTRALQRALNGIFLILDVQRPLVPVYPMPSDIPINAYPFNRAAQCMRVHAAGPRLGLGCSPGMRRTLCCHYNCGEADGRESGFCMISAYGLWC